MIAEHPTPHAHPPRSAFVTTRWTQVVAARGDSPEAKQALSELCAACYAPVVAFLRREGRDEDAARELAHAFFARLLERPALQGADPQRGRFRSYLLGALKHFIANQRLHDRREKRAGVHEAFDEESSVADPSAISLEAAFDREWAVNVLTRALAVMQREAEADGKARNFDRLNPWLTGDAAGRSAADTAGELGWSEGAVRVAIHRLRRRFRELVKAEIAQTLSQPGDVAEELQHLIAALSS